jgi:general stress protein 26
MSPERPTAPRPIDARARETITRIIKSCVYGDLATVAADGSPRVRPVCAFLEEDALTLLVPSHARTRKVAEIAANPRVEIVFVDKEHWQVRVSGRAEVVEDLGVKRRLVETTLTPKLWRGFFPQGEKDPQFVLYRIQPRSFEWMKEWELDYRRVEP